MIYVSLGGSCEVAKGLKDLGMLHESARGLPLNRIVSYIPFIKECLETDFEHYADIIMRDDLEWVFDPDLTFRIKNKCDFLHEFPNKKSLDISNKEKKEWQVKARECVARFRALKAVKEEITFIYCGPNHQIEDFKKQVKPLVNEYFGKEVKIIYHEMHLPKTWPESKELFKKDFLKQIS